MSAAANITTLDDATVSRLAERHLRERMRRLLGGEPLAPAEDEGIGGMLAWALLNLAENPQGQAEAGHMAELARCLAESVTAPEPSAEPPLHTLYTFGYQGRSVEQLASELARLGALLLDIRFQPASRQPGWSARELKARLGRDYRWAQALGNTNYKGGPIALAAPEQAVEVVYAMLQARPVVLLCACRQRETCHRKVAAEYLSEALGCATAELEVWL